MQLSFTLPLATTPGALVALYPGFFCSEPVGTSGCDTGAHLLRFVPEP